MPAEKWDVIIAGGGPSGLSTALHLVERDPKWSSRVLIIEKSHHPRPKLCGGGITPYGISCLEKLGLDIREVPIVPIEELRTLHGAHRATIWKGVWLQVIRRNEFDAWLAGKVRERGVALHEGETVNAAHAHKTGVTVETSAGTYEAATFVVADGSNGTLRRKLGIEEKERVGRALEILTPVPEDDPLYTSRTAIFDFTPSAADLQGYYWDFPCVVGGKAHVNRGVYDARALPERKRADLKAILAACLAQRGIDLAQCELMGHPIRWYDPSGTYSLPRVLLVGDAVGADPMLGEGIAFALGYGAVAAEAIHDAFRRKKFGYDDYSARIRGTEHGAILDFRNQQARRLYRHRKPLAVPAFMP